MDEKTTKRLQYFRAELLEATKMSYLDRRDISYRVYQWARGTPPNENRPIFESLWDAAVMLRYACPRGHKWNYYTDQICQLRFSICENEEEYRKLVSVWWQFARPADKKVHREKHYKGLSEEEEFQLTVSTIEAIAGEQSAAAYVLTGDQQLALQGAPSDKFNELYNERRSSMVWRWTGGETLSCEYWLRAHIENTRRNVHSSNLSPWMRDVDASKFYQPSEI